MQTAFVSPEITVIPDGKICDYIDRKLRDDTPEEYVRQNIEKRLVNEHKYDKSRIQVEFVLHIGSRKPRADIVIFPKDCSSQTQANVQIVIECKQEKVDPRAKKDGVPQMQSYMAVCPNCEWGLWTNGKHKEVFRRVVEDGRITFQEYNDIPSADGSVEDVDRPTRNTLKNAVEDNLLFVFKTCHNHIAVIDGLEKPAAFFELLKVIFCKIEDERNFPSPLEFYTTSAERSNPDGQLTVKNRIGKIFDRVKSKYNRIFAPNDVIGLKPRSLVGSPGLAYIRQWLIMKTKIIASVDLHADTFQPRNGTQTSVLFLQKKTPAELEDELRAGQVQPYNIFMAMVERIGHDKRGNPIFKRDEQGNELLVPEADVRYFGGESEFVATEEAPTSTTRVIDDQTSAVPPIFTEWKKQEGVPW